MWLPCWLWNGPDTKTWHVCSPLWQSRSCPQRKTHWSPYWTPCWQPPLCLSAGEHNTCSNQKVLQKNYNFSLQNLVEQYEVTFQAQTLTIMSCWFPTLTMYLPLGENATHETPYLCVWSSATWLRSATSHTLTAGRWPLWWTGQGYMCSIRWVSEI